MTILEAYADMFDRRIIGHRRVFNIYRINATMGAANVRQRVEEMGRTVNGFEMGNILFLDPYRVQRHTV